MLFDKLRALWHRRQLDEDLRAELEHHRALSGGPKGPGLYWQEETREQWIFPRLEALAQDLRTAARRLRRDRGFTLVAVLTLALGVGATTAIFTLINALALRPLPVPQPEQLVRFVLTNLPPTDRQWIDGRPVPARERTTVSFVLYEAIRKRADLYQGFFATAGTGDIHVEYNGVPRQVPFGVVTGSIFQTLGVQPQAGRLFDANDDIEGGRPGTTWPAVISDALWSQMFGRSPQAIGATITVDRVPFVITGVCPPTFTGISPGIARDLWIPLSSTESVFPLFKWRRNPGSGPLRVFARLKPGVSAAQAAQFTAAIARSVLEESVNPSDNAEGQRYWKAMRLEVRPGATGFPALGTYLEPLTILMAAVVGVLLIAAANLTSLFLARATARGHELAIRVSLGAPAFRLRLELLMESGLVALAGVIAGYLLGQWLARGLQLLGSSENTIVTLDTSFDLRTFGFLAVTLIVVTLIAGLAPAWRAGRTAPYSALKKPAGSMRLRAGLAILQTALSLALVAGAGMMAASLRSLLTEETGYDAAQSVFLWPDLFNAGISRERMAEAYKSLADRLRADPQVAGAGWTDLMPLAGGLRMNTIELPGRDLPVAARQVFTPTVTDGYLAGAGIPLKAGVDLPPLSAQRPASVLMSESAAIHFYGSAAGALGQRFKYDGEWMQIVGVAADAMHNDIREARPWTVYLPLGRGPVRPGLSLALRYRGSQQAAVATATRIFAQEAGRVPFIEVRTITGNVAGTLSRERLLTWLLGALALLALAISATGLAGLLSYLVEQRRRDLGIRLALGATARHVRGLIVRHALTLTAAGLALGGALSYALRRSLDSFVFGITPGDPRVWLIGCALLLLAALAASAAPAWRAGRIDPLRMLRND